MQVEIVLAQAILLHACIASAHARECLMNDMPHDSHAYCMPAQVLTVVNDLVVAIVCRIGQVHALALSRIPTLHSAAVD